MAESVAFTVGASRAVRYAEITPQIEALVADEADLIANLANITAVLKEAFDFLWIGFYLKKDGKLLLVPFQGPVACTRIDFGKGVCGHAYSTAETVVVPNVDEFPGHIACSSEAKSEIVVPVFDREGGVIGVLDVDSNVLDDFSETDVRGLKTIAEIITTK